MFRRFQENQSFTLIELLIAVGIVGILATATVLLIRPVELLRQSRDATRLSELGELNRVLARVLVEVPNINFGTSSTVYVSLPDPDSVCTSYNLPVLPSGWSYSCRPESSFRKVDGTGWIPINFTNVPTGSLSALPVDPVNSDENGLYYTYVPGSWKLTAIFESNKYKVKMQEDQGVDDNTYEVGSDLTLAGFGYTPPDPNASKLLARLDSNLTNSGNGNPQAGSFNNNNSFGFRTLTGGSNPPANLAGNLGVLLTQSDNLQYTRGSLQGGDGSGVVYENFSPNQGTLEFWVRPNWNGNDGLDHIVFAINRLSTGSVANSIAIKKEASTDTINIIWRGNEATVRYTSQDIASWTAGTWYHIVAVWDMNNAVSGSNKIEMYVNGSITGNIYHSATGTFTAWSSVGSVMYIGQDNGLLAKWDGVIAGRILNRPLTSTEVTALYASGAGHTDTFTVTPDTVWLGTYSDSDTDAIFQHRGQSVASITNTATESTLTLGQAVGSRSWKDNDRVVVWDGTGYKKEGLIDEASIATTDTTIDVDNGAGALVTDLDKVGVYATLNGTTQYFSRADNASLSITGDMTIQGWIKTSATSNSIAAKWKATGNERSYAFGLYSSGSLAFSISSNGLNIETVYGNEAVNNNKWHKVAVVYDATAETAIFYIDGHADSGGTKTFTTVTGALNDNTSQFTIGKAQDGSGSTLNAFAGSIRNVQLFNDKRTVAEILTDATNPMADNSGNANNVSQWLFIDAATQTNPQDSNANANHLTLNGGTTTNYGTHSRTQQAFISRNLISDSEMEQGGIGGWFAVSGGSGTFIKEKISDAKFDTRSIRFSHNTSGGGYSGAYQFIATAPNENYLLSLWDKVDPGGTARVYAGAGVTLFNQDNGGVGTTNTTWEYEESVFKTAGSTLQIGMYDQYGTNVPFAYFDQFQLLPSLVDNGGFDHSFTSKPDANIFNANTIGKTGSGWTPNAYQNKVVYIYYQTGSGQYRDIVSNTSDTLTVTPNWTTTPDNTSDFVILNWQAGLAGSWLKAGTVTVNRTDTKHTGGGGVYVGYSQVVTGGNTSNNVYQTVSSLIPGRYYSFSGWLYRAGGSGNAAIELSGAATQTLTHNAASWKRVSHTFKAASGSLIIELYNSDSGTTGLFDDIALIEIDQDDPTTTGATTPSTLATSFNTGKYDSALLVDGKDVLIYPTSGNITANQGTIAMWVKLNGTPDASALGYWRYFFYSGGTSPIDLYQHSTNDYLYTNNRTAFNTAAASWAANTWHHIAYTWDNSTDEHRIYIDGVESTNNQTAWVDRNLGTTMYIGNSISQQADAFFDEVRIYNRVLSNSEINDLFQASSPP